VLGASAVVDAAIAAVREEPENKTNKEEYYNIGDCTEEIHGDNKNKDNLGKDRTRDDPETRQLCDLSMEELNKRTDQAIEDLDRGKARDLVAEISRRALSPDLSAVSARANNSQLRTKITSLEQEIKSLRKEIKKYTNAENKSRGRKAPGSDLDHTQVPYTEGEETCMEWTISDLGSKQSPTYNYELN